MKKLLTLISVLAGIVASTSVFAADFRAGSASFKAGQAGIYVKVIPAMPNARYAVTVQPTNTAGYSSAKQCTYFNVLKKTPTVFQVQHKTCKDGTPIKLDTNVSLNWIIASYQ